VRLDFNVLWVEDQQQAVLAQKVRLERIIKADGFRLRVEFAVSVAQAKKYLEDDLYGDNVDLILMDYNLRGGLNGDVGLKEVRKLMPYKDIIFYSAAANNLRAIVADGGIEGVYLSDRDALPETAGLVFENLVKKVLDIDHSRGIAMGVTSDIDAQINDCLLHIFDGVDSGKQADAIQKVHERLDDIEARHAKSGRELRVMKHLSELLDHHGLYSSKDRLRLLLKLLDTNALYENDVDKSALKRYMVETIEKRNVLAHVKVTVDGFKRKLFLREGKEFTGAEMKRFRQELLEAANLFDRLAERLAALKKT
jgi:hypothetical protein